MRCKFIMGAIGVFCLIAALGVCTLPGYAADADIVKIGTLDPMTGGLALSGQDTYRGIKVAADMQNARGGVHGKKIVLLKGDTETLKSAITEAERLINVEGVKLFCGHYSSSRAKASTTVTEKYKRVSFIVMALADELTSRKFKYVFQAPGRAGVWGTTAADFVANQAAPKLGKKPQDLTIAIAHEDSDFGTSISNGFEKRAKEIGMQIVCREPYSYKALDLSSVVMRIKRTNPDILVLTPYIRDGILFLQQARDAKLSPKMILCPGGPLSNQIFYEKLGDDMNYMVVLSVASLDVRQDAFQPEGWAALQEFRKRFRKEFKVEANQDVYDGFHSAWFFFHYVLPRSKSLEPDDVEQCLRKIELAPGESTVTYGYKFAPMSSSNPGANVRGYPNIFQWQKGSINHMVFPPKFAGSQLILPMPPWGQRGMK